MLVIMVLSLANAALPKACETLRQPRRAAERLAEAKRISRDAKQRIKPADVSMILAEGPWRLVWATPADAERGVYFYRRAANRTYRLVDTWGGVIPAEERTETVGWARQRAGHPPTRIAGCFADALIAGY